MRGTERRKLVADVSDADERRRVIAHLTGVGTPVNIFVDNAGSMQYFALTDADALIGSMPSWRLIFVP